MSTSKFFKIIEIVSSLELFQNFMNSIKARTNVFSSSTMEILVNSLFTNVTLGCTVDIIQRISDQEIQTAMTEKQLKKLLLILCPKSIPFTFGSKFFVQPDGVVIVSPLGPVLADISQYVSSNLNWIYESL